MIYGPMTKVVSENTDPLYSTRCALGYTFSSFLGSPAAGLLAMFMTWQSVFFSSSMMLFAMSLLGMILFTVLEKKKIVQYGKYEKQKTGIGNIRALLERKIIKYMLVSIITGIVRTSVVFWLPTYISQHLKFETNTAVGIYTATTLVIAMTSFITVFIYERLGHDIEKTVLLMFILSAIFFTATYFVKVPIVNVACIVLAIMGSNGAACMMWSRYCPSLRDTGMVSTVTGFLDFLSYMAAAAANMLFANAITTIGWGNLIIVWIILEVCGVIVALPYDKIIRRRDYYGA